MQQAGNATTRVFLVDDHEIVRRGLRELLETVAEFEAALDFIEGKIEDGHIRKVKGNSYLEDLISGNAVAGITYPSTKALILTSFDDERALSSAILAGAAGYLLKDIKGNGLIEAIRAVARGQQLLSRDDVERARRAWARKTQADPRLQRLSPQEQRVLDHIAQGLTNREIGVALSLAEKTVKNYVTAVLGKLGVESRTQAAVFAATHPATPKDPRPR